MTAPSIADYFIQADSVDNQVIDFSVPGNAGGSGFTGIAGYLILCCYYKRDGFVDPLPVPTGYTLLDPDDFGAGGLFQDGIAVFAKDAAGGETGFTMPDVPGGSTGDILVVLHLDGGAVADLITSTAGQTSANPIVGTITPTAGVDVLLLAFATAAHDTTASWSVDAGWTILDQKNKGNGHPIDLEAYQAVTNPSGAYTITATEAAGHNKKMIMVAVSGEPPVIPPPIPGPVFAVDGVAFDNLLEARCRIEFNAAGQGYMVLSKGDPQAVPEMLYRGARVTCTFPEIDPDPIFEFFLEEGDFKVISGEEEGGEKLAFGGPGTLSMLRRAIVREEEFLDGIGYPKPNRGVWKFNENNTEGHIINKLIREAQAPDRPAAPLLGMTRTFDSDEDTDGVAWADQTLEGFWRVKIGTNLYDAIMRLVNSGLLSVEMAPGLVLNAYRERGVDRHSTSFAAGKIRFVKGVNIADELDKDMAGQIFATHALVRFTNNDDEIRYINVTKDAGDFDYDVEVFIESEATHANTARRSAKRSMALREEAQDAIIFGHIVPWPGDPTDDTIGLYLPGPTWSEHGQYWVGDLVTLDTGIESSQFEFNNNTKRVYAITLFKDDTGYLGPPIVELNAPHRKRRRGRTLAGISGTLSDSGSGGTTGSGGGGSGAGGSSGIGTAAYQVLAEKGQDDGYAGLDSDGHVPADQLGTGSSGSGARVLADNGTWISPVTAVDPIEVVVYDGLTPLVFDFAVARRYDVLLEDDVPDYSFANPPDDGEWGEMWVVWRQGTGAPHTVTHPAEVVTDDGSGGQTAFAPTLYTAVDAVNVHRFVTEDGGVSYGAVDETPGSGGGGGPMALDDLTDVNAPSPADLDVLTWDDGAGEWIAAAATGGGGGGTVHRVHLRHSASQSISVNPTVLEWDTEDVDTDGFHSTVTNTGRITIPSGLAGTYAWSVAVESNGTGSPRIALAKNAAGSPGPSNIFYLSKQFNGDFAVHLAGLIDLAVGDYIEVYVTGTTSGSIVNTDLIKNFAAVLVAASSGTDVAASPTWATKGDLIAATGNDAAAVVPAKAFSGSRLEEDTSQATGWKTVKARTIFKSADESVTSSTTMQDDNDFVLPVAANEKWLIEVVAFWQCNGSNGVDVKINFSTPASPTTLRIGVFAPGTGATSAEATPRIQAIDTGVDIPHGVLDTTTLGHTPAIYKIYFENGANSGNLTFRWAQNNSSGTSMTLKKGSWMKAELVP